MDDALHWLDDVESDEIFNIVQKLEKELLAEGFSIDSIGDVEENSETKPADEVVGATAEQLESIKELIEFDHVYHKTAPSEESDCTAVADSFTSENQMDITVYEGSDDPIEGETCEITSMNPCITLTEPDEGVDEPEDDVVFLCSTKNGPSLTTDLSSAPSILRNANMAFLGVQKREESCSDSDYESASSLLSPFSDREVCPSPEENEEWDNTLVELFPSLM